MRKRGVMLSTLLAVAAIHGDARAQWAVLPQPDVPEYGGGCNELQTFGADVVYISALSPATASGFAPAFIKSTDGGQTWSGGPVTGLGPSLTGQGAQLHFASPTTGYLLWTTAAGATIVFTSDGGATWTTTGQPAGRPRFVWALDATTAVASGEVGTSSAIWRTTNSGGTWTQVATGAASTAGGRILFFDGQVGIAHGDSTGVIRTVDGGVTWTPVANVPGGTLNGSASKVSATEAFFLHASPSRRLYRTADAGQTFTQVNTALPCLALSVAFLDSMHGLLGCTSAQGMGRNYYTADGGLTWSPEAWPSDWSVNGATTGNGAWCMSWPAANAAYAHNDGAPGEDRRAIKRTGTAPPVIDGGVIDAASSAPDAGGDAAMGGGGGGGGGCSAGASASGLGTLAAVAVLAVARRRRRR